MCICFMFFMFLTRKAAYEMCISGWCSDVCSSDLCGFSSRAIALLDRLGVGYETVDVLQDMEVRQGIKEFSDWPTIPQLYVKGEFVGGSDIMMEMWEAGELHTLMNGIPPRAE